MSNQLTKSDLIKIVLESNDKQLLLDKKKCPKCDDILLDGVDICKTCGFNVKESEELFETIKQIWNPKFVSEQVNANPTMVSADALKKDPDILKKVKKSDPNTQISVTDEVVDKSEKNNPWAICTASVGRGDKKKFERCVKKVKKQEKIDEDLRQLEEYMSRIIVDSEQNPKMTKGSFTKFVSKLK